MLFLQRVRNSCIPATNNLNNGSYIETKKKRTMKKKIKTKEEAKAFFQKIIDDKNAMIDCIENGGDMKTLIKNRGIEIAKPILVHQKH